MNPLDLFIPVAHAQAASAGAAGSGIVQILPFILVVIFVVVFMILPQSRRTKQHRDMIAKLQKGDEVVTTGGLAGRVAGIGDSFIILEIAEGVQVKFQRAAIGMVLPRGSLKAS